MSFHAQQSGADVHVPYAFSYADAATRTGATGLTSGDVGKLARQTDDDSLWMLTATTPTWVEISGHSVDNFYTANGSFTGARTVLTSPGSITLEARNAGGAGWTAESELLLLSTFTGLNLNVGDGAGGVSSSRAISLSNSQIVITDSTASRGAEYAADYSANFVARSLIDKAYSDAGSLLRSNLDFSTFTARTVTGQLNSQLTLQYNDAAPTTYTRQTEFDIRPLSVNIIYRDGNGAGGSTGSRSIEVSNTDIIIRDSIGSKGAVYIADYSANYVARSLVDKAYADTRGIYGIDGTVSGNRVVTMPSDRNLVVNAYDATASDFTRRALIDIDSTDVVIGGFDGDGAGASSGQVTLGVGPFGATMRDDGGTGGIQYFADYSGDYTARSLVDKAYSDAGSLLRSDLTFNGGTRTVSADNGTILSFLIYNLTSSNWTTRTNFGMSSTVAFLSYATGNGAGGSTGNKEISLNSSNILITDTVSNKGMQYAADYSANYVDRSLVDRAYARGRVTGGEATLIARGTPGVLSLQTSVTAVVADTGIGFIDFLAPLEASGTDATTVCANIRAVAEGDFTASANPASLAFFTSDSGLPTEKGRFTSDGQFRVGLPATTTAKGRAVIHGNASDVNLGPSLHFMIGSDAHPTMQFQNFAHDNMAILFDMYWDGSNFVSSDVGTNFSIQKLIDGLWFGLDAGVAVGGTVAQPSSSGGHVMRIGYTDSNPTLAIGNFAGNQYALYSQNGLLSFVGNSSGLPNAQIYNEDVGPTTTTISTSNTWVQVLHFDANGPSVGATPDHTNDHITVLHSGTYLVTVTARVQFEISTSNTMEHRVFVNNGSSTGIVTLTQASNQGAGADVISFSGLAELSANDTVELWVRNINGTTNVAYHSLSMSLVMVGG